MCDQLTTSLPTDFKTAALHGDKMQRERDYVLAAFRRVSVSVAFGFSHQHLCLMYLGHRTETEKSITAWLKSTFIPQPAGQHTYAGGN